MRSNALPTVTSEGSATNSKICGLTACLKRNSSSYRSKSSYIPNMPPTHQPTQMFVVFKWLMAYFKLRSNSGIHGYYILVSCPDHTLSRGETPWRRARAGHETNYILRCFVGHISPHHNVPHSLSSLGICMILTV